MQRVYRSAAPSMTTPASMPALDVPGLPPRGKKRKKVALAGGVLAFIALVYTLSDLASVETLMEHRADLLAFTQRHYALMLLLATAAYATAAILSLPLGVVMSIGMGFLFGRWMGTAVVVVGGTSGSVAAFLGARYLFGDRVRAHMGPRLKRLARGFERDAFPYMLFTRLVPFFPFWFINFVPAFTPVATRTFFSATLLGIAPGAFVFANLGQSLGRISSPRELVRPAPLVALSMLGVLALIPTVYKKLKTRKSEQSA